MTRLLRRGLVLAFQRAEILALAGRGGGVRGRSSSSLPRICVVSHGLARGQFTYHCERRALHCRLGLSDSCAA